MEQAFSNREGLLKNNSVPKSNVQAQQQGNMGQTAQLAAVNPGALTSGNIAQLQKTLGNQAVTQLLSRQPVQRAGGPEEEEPLQGKFATVQRAAPEEEEIQMKTLQRSAEEEEEIQT